MSNKNVHHQKNGESIGQNNLNLTKAHSSIDIPQKTYETLKILKVQQDQIKQCQFAHIIYKKQNGVKTYGQ